MFEFPFQLGVVPILVNVSAPMLPAFIAGVVSLLSLLARPRELLDLCRRRRGVVLSIAGAMACIIGATWLWPRSAEAGTDWANVARKILEKRVQASAVAPGGKLDFRESGRSRYDAGPVPVGLSPLWSFEKRGTMFLSSPAVYGDRVFGASALVDVAENYGSVFCLDADTGRLIWEVEQINGRDLKAIYSSPALSEDGRSVIVGEGLHYDENCALSCFDAETGKLRWSVQTPLHIESSPAVMGDFVVVGAGAIEGPGHAPTRPEGEVLCVRISDGMVMWRFPATDPESSPALSADGVAYVGSGIGGDAVVALRLAGEDAERLLWRTTMPYPATGPVAIAGELVLAPTGRGDLVRRSSEPAGAVVALERQTGRIRWRTDFDDGILGGVAVADGIVFCPVRNGEVVALDLADGRPVWRQKLPGGPALLSNPVVAQGLVYVASADGVLVLLNAKSGEVRERHLLNRADLPGKRDLSLSTPVIAGGRLLVGSETGGLRCFGGTTR